MLKHTNKLNLSTYTGILLLVFTIITFISVLFLKNNSIVSNKLEQEIMFNTIQRDTSKVLTRILYKYEQEKHLLREKHEIVSKYINKQKNPLDTNLQEIYSEINGEDHKYNIYITDDDLVIKNTTFKNDIGFDLSFAEGMFEKHKTNRTIGVSTPIIELSSKKFFSYSDEFLRAPNDKKILQVSYTYEGLESLVKNLDSNVNKYKKIQDLKAYLYIEKENFTTEFYFKTPEKIKPSLKELLDISAQGKELSKLNLNIPIQNIIKIDNEVFNEVYIIEESPFSSDSIIMYSILFNQTEHENMLKIYEILLYLIIVIFIISLVIIFSMRENENKFKYDNLTKTLNRNGFDYIYSLETKRCDRYKNPFSMIMLDIDFFKKVNDTHGHLVGDDTLIFLCDLINKSIRESDYLIRWGGEEFLILAPELDLTAALKLAEKVRSLVESTLFSTVGHITVSLSVAQKNYEETDRSFLKRLDDLLYESKRSGRNKISS